MIEVEQGRQPDRYRDRLTTLCALFATLLGVIALVSLTGGLVSPFKMLFLVPVFLASFGLGMVPSLVLAIGILLLAIVQFATVPQSTLTVPHALGQAVTFLTTSICIGLFNERMTKRAEQAVVGANEQAHRAAQVEWFSDTALMMQSIPQLEQCLSVALLRLDERIAFDSAAILLRENDESELRLVQAMGLTVDRIGVHTITIREQTDFDGLSQGFFAWTEAEKQRMRPFADIDTQAVSGMVVSLCTLDAMIGIVYLGTRRSSGFTEEEQAVLQEFSQHILYPIQRATLQAMATRDLLTGLYNRRALWEHLRSETERLRRYHRSLSLLLIDIDHFKRINDTYGHLTGDAILHQLGDVIRKTIRESDFGARYGGEELAVLCPETTNEEAMQCAERLRRAIAETVFHSVDGRPLCLTVSIGAATMPEDAYEPQGLVEAADTALYEAKASGRNRVCNAQKAGTSPFSLTFSV